MEQEKIGKFIKWMRKQKNITQSELADKLNITDRAISKWERGLCLPDSSIMIKLCDILEISVNELLSGRRINKDEIKNISEENLIELKKECETNTKKLLLCEIIMILISTTFLAATFYIIKFNLRRNIEITLLILSIFAFLISIIFAISIEAKVGYYECSRCHYKFKPSYKDILFSVHISHLRKMKCPKCGIKSWQKKISNK